MVHSRNERGTGHVGKAHGFLQKTWKDLDRKPRSFIAAPHGFSAILVSVIFGQTQNGAIGHFGR